MPTLTVSTEVADEVADLIGNGLDANNKEKAGPHNPRDLWVVARDASGAVIGGLKGKTEYAWLFVDWLWVSPAQRGQGLGTQLLRRAEQAARARGCVGAYLSSATFQAPDFYRRHGYAEIGCIEGFPPGHALVWFAKPL